MPRLVTPAIAPGSLARLRQRGESLHRDGWHDMHLHARLAGDPRPALA